MLAAPDLDSAERQSLNSCVTKTAAYECNILFSGCLPTQNEMTSEFILAIADVEDWWNTKVSTLDIVVTSVIALLLLTILLIGRKLLQFHRMFKAINSNSSYDFPHEQRTGATRPDPELDLDAIKRSFKDRRQQFEI